MRREHMPAIDLRYWLGITLASVFGTNMGDFYAHESGLGIAAGLAVLALLCAGVFVVEKLDGGARELYYWLVIIIIRTGATNIADFSAYRLHIPELLLNGGLILLLAILALVQRRAASSQAVTSVAAQLPDTGALYWAAMLTAGVLGTVLGDVCEHAFGEGVAAVGLSVVLVVTLLVGSRASGTVYWLIVAVARTAGTAIGDWLAENHILNIGLRYSTLITGIVFVGVLALWRSETKPWPVTDRA